MSSKKKALSKLNEIFKQCESNRYVCSQSKLFEELWLKDSKSNLLQQAEELDIPENFRMAYYQKVNPDMVYRFETVLGFNSKFDDMMVSHNGFICDTDHLVHVCDENGISVNRKLTEDEIDLVLKVRYNLAQNVFGGSPLSVIATSGLSEKYNELFKAEMRKAGSNIEYVYEVYKFTFLKEDLVN